MFISCEQICHQIASEAVSHQRLAVVSFNLLVLMVPVAPLQRRGTQKVLGPLIASCSYISNLDLVSNVQRNRNKFKQTLILINVICKEGMKKKPLYQRQVVSLNISEYISLHDPTCKKKKTFSRKMQCLAQQKGINNC